MINQHAGATTHVVDQFEATDLGAPFKVILKDCVKVVSDEATGKRLSYTIPDPDGLLRAVVLSRILHPRKLSGADIKFLRKAVGVMQKDAAKSIGLSPEHLCKCESGALPITPGSEKLLRLFLFSAAIKQHKAEDSKAKTAMLRFLDRLFDELTPVAVYNVEEELIFRFHRVPRQLHADNDRESPDCEPEYELEDEAA